MRTTQRRRSPPNYPPEDMPVLALNHRTGRLDNIDPLLFQKIKAHAMKMEPTPGWRDDPTYDLRRRK